VPGAGACQNAAARQETKAVQQAVKAFGPLRMLARFGDCNGLRHPLPGGMHIGLFRGPIAGLPDVPGDFHAEGRGQRHSVSGQAER